MIKSSTTFYLVFAIILLVSLVSAIGVHQRSNNDDNNNNNEIKSSMKLRAEPYRKSGIECPDGSYCDSGSTCCPSGNGGYSCCPSAGASCCSDFKHCCPAGFTCNRSDKKHDNLDRSTILVVNINNTVQVKV
ncbi:granulin domain-containing protein [Heterostelium album PN500]|uniref:Granulin domain-containing protein n=1 Tax=Heterostelium pallidum (strain ATCC 26659 / Pp 5 / PN500) TaxID=670386 RepID=D3B1I0_HETP5|nr:granulin domain-containing protein [Heterostelium album PN500]EFA85154.1 granulin domain-containing protein [Heterostelium album PN500]|eukprot:XP_020437263.1 granulin domain-containing protein [Heterostelium album PN500]